MIENAVQLEQIIQKKAEPINQGVLYWTDM